MAAPQKNKNALLHGGKGTKLYNVWQSMKQRVLNQKHKYYKDYGDRGIIICPEWANDYVNFRDWALNNGYKENLQINRINNNGNYEPPNCNFVTSAENCQNRRSNKITMQIANEIRDLWKTGDFIQKELAEKYNISKREIRYIINSKHWVMNEQY